ncbi:hypothetical protein [Cohnella sp. WQ 127256]|uniref:hypothetical protein n=1 Tax=Cohnella sp. WQ 127256 TaxID=2938790 RepID=UPI0021174803|nr:hypothetical protein [Cohnella sp. WQ 127256]
MFKWVSWVIRMGATALLLSFLCIWTTGYIVNSYMETVVKQLGIPIDLQPIALSGVWGTLWGAEKSPKVEASVSKPPASIDDSDAIESSPPKTQEVGEATQVPTGNGVNATQEEAAPTGDTVVKPKVDESTNTDNGGQVDAVPAFNEDIAMGQLTDEERQSLYAMVVSKLNPEQLKQLSDSLKDGLTSEELVQVQSMLKSSLSDQEYIQMTELLKGQKQPATEDSLE